MKNLILEVRSRAAVFEHAKQVLKSGKPDTAARISYATPQMLLRVLAGKRIELIEAMCGKGPMTIRAAAGLVGRDVKGVYTDIAALVKAGVLSQDESGVEFPYQSVRVDFTVNSPAMRKAG